jgi:hypothetical protein
MSSTTDRDGRLVPADPLARPLAIGLLVVIGLGLAVELIHAAGGHGDAIEVAVGLLSLSHEQNLPTWYATCLLFACAAALVPLARAAAAGGGRFGRRWWGMVVALGWVSFDEASELHEHLGGLVGGGGLLYFDWVVPAAAIGALLAALYLPLVRALPPATRRRFVVAAALYVGGALVM